jgi:thiol:disulfide interchange protein DsbD
MGFTMTQTIPVALFIFTIFGIGIASPYVILSFFPSLINKLPRPGAWMETFKQFMAFALFATAVFFMKSLGAQTGTDGLWWFSMALVIFGLAAYCYGHWFLPHKSVRTRYALGLALPLVIAGIAVWMTADAVAMRPPAIAAVTHDGLRWESWRPGIVELARTKKRVVWVDYTADW